MKNIENNQEKTEINSNENNDNFMEKYNALRRNTGSYKIDVFKNGLKLLAKGEILDAKKQFGEAIDLGLKGQHLKMAYYYKNNLKKSIELSPYSPDAHCDLAEAYYAKGDYNSALKKYTDALECDREMEEALIGRGRTLIKLGRFLDALKDFQRVVKLNPTSENGYFWQGITYYNIDSYKQALKAFDKDIQIDPNCASTYGWRGKIHELLRNFNHALINYNKALDLDREKIDIYYHRGRLYMMLCQYKNAINDFDDAIIMIEDIELIERDEYRGWPEKELFYYERGCAYFEIEKYINAIDDFDEANLNSIYLEVCLKRAFAHFMIGFSKEAKVDLEKAESIAAQS